jgi:GAF domain-containing protein
MRFKMRWSAGHLPESVAKYSRPIDDVLAGAAFRHGEIVDRPDVESDPDFRRNAKAKRSFASLYALPLRVDEDIVGALSVVSTVPNAFGAADLTFIEIIAALVDVVLAHERDAERFSDAVRILSAEIRELRKRRPTATSCGARSPRTST